MKFSNEVRNNIFEDNQGRDVNGVDKFERIIILARLFDLMALVAGMSAHLEQSGTIDKESSEKIREIFTSAQAFIASIMDCDHEEITLAAEFSGIDWKRIMSEFDESFNVDAQA